LVSAVGPATEVSAELQAVKPDERKTKKKARTANRTIQQRIRNSGPPECTALAMRTSAALPMHFRPRAIV